MPTSTATSKNFTTSVLLLYYFFTTVPTSTASSKNFATSVLLLYYFFTTRKEVVINDMLDETVFLLYLLEGIEGRGRERRKETTC